MFSKAPRCQYESNQLAEVICQLRFPEILTINTTAPATFQEKIRSVFPQYSVNVEEPAPKVTSTPNGLRLEKPATINNYCFASADGVWRVNMTSRFISLACSRYINWETFARQLDLPLVAFIKVYKPAYFERIGLRYLNFISRSDLGLQDVPFSELFAPEYLGPLANDDIREQDALKCSVDAEIKLPGGCQVKIHTGPGIVKRNGQTDKEIKFILDQDLYMTGNIPVNHSAGALETLHSQAYPIFRGAITDKLHSAMDPD